MNVVYASATRGPHDRRFLEAISGLGCEVVHLQITKDVSQGPSHFVAWGARGLNAAWQTIRSSFAPTLVHAGPIQEVAFPLMDVIDVPLIPMSWGSDLLLPPSRDHLWSYATEAVLGRSEVFFADCVAVESEARLLGFDGTTFSFPWGVDVEQFAPPQARVGKDITFISVRNWHPIYNVETVIKAYARIAEKYPNSKLLVVGSGPDEGEIRRQISKVQHGTIVVLGRVSATELTSLLRTADVYISASLSDGSSISLLEAMACGLAPIISDIPGNREWVVEEDNGWLFPPTDDHRLSELMARSASALDETRRTGSKNVEIARTRADWNHNKSLIIQGYEMVASCKAM